MANNPRIPSAPPKAPHSPPPNKAEPAPSKPPEPAHAKAQPHEPAPSHAQPKRYAESLKAAAQKGAELHQEGFAATSSKPGANKVAGLSREALFGNEPPATDMSKQRIDNPSNPAHFPPPKSFFDLATISMSSYHGDKNQGKIALYDAGKTLDGNRAVLVDIAGTEFDFSGQHSNSPANWGAAGSGARTDLERETVGAIQDAYRRGDIPKGSVIDLTGHSLGAITAHNISGRGIDGSAPGRIPVVGPDGTAAELPIRNVIAFGTPKPSIWSNDVRYHDRVAAGDVVANLPTDQVNGTRINQWAQEPNGPPGYDRQTVHLEIPKDDKADGGHMQYDKSRESNPLASEPVPPALAYPNGLNLIGAYRNPALGEPPPVDPGVREMENTLLSPRVQGELDHAFPNWRSWLNQQTDEQLKNLPAGVRNEIGQSVDSIFRTYLDSDRYQRASPEERKAILKQDEARLRDAVGKVSSPLANELLRQDVLDWWKNHVPHL